MDGLTDPGIWGDVGGGQRRLTQATTDSPCGLISRAVPMSMSLFSQGLVRVRGSRSAFLAIVSRAIAGGRASARYV
jgi:hypothetical protein